MPKTFTTAEVASHKTKGDLYIVIHDKIYDVTSFVDEHPGGEEVLLEVSGQDGTEAFEDVGHSDNAREALARLEVGILKRLPGQSAPTNANPSTSDPEKASTGLGVGLYVIVLVGLWATYVTCQYVEARSGKR
ncbi:cytochrome b5 [Aspergillus ustus]|uniref:Cytochrome b5 n=1 Tax=Aspergillus ustus TaxID=40382 RepID=A0A0C1C3G6_ASPUT|nr:cytochrome b5 [Aspergillus ustus]